MKAYYKISLEFLTSVKDLFYIEAPATADQLLDSFWKVATSKYRQGYTSDENSELIDPDETSGANPRFYTYEEFKAIVEEQYDEDGFFYYFVMQRVPFYGHTVDPSTFEVDVTPTGMTETITLKLYNRPTGAVNPDTIPIFPINCGGM